MTVSKNNDPLKELLKINKEVLSFDFMAPKSEQEKQIQTLAAGLIELNNELHITAIAEVGGDLITIGSCALGPVHIVPCLEAIVAGIDLIKVAIDSKSE